MPITKQAEKKLRHDKKRTAQNRSVGEKIRKLMKAMRKTPSKKAYEAVTKALDKASKLHVIHANKAARIKSRLSKLLKK